MQSSDGIDLFNKQLNLHSSWVCIEKPPCWNKQDRENNQEANMGKKESRIFSMQQNIKW